MAGSSYRGSRCLGRELIEMHSEIVGKYDNAGLQLARVWVIGSRVYKP